MCCFKRLAAKMKRKAGWARRERAPSVTRPSQAEIDRGKEKAVRSCERKERRALARITKEEERLRSELSQQKGWAT